MLRCVESGAFSQFVDTVSTCSSDLLSLSYPPIRSRCRGLWHIAGGPACACSPVSTAACVGIKSSDFFDSMILSPLAISHPLRLSFKNSTNSTPARSIAISCFRFRLMNCLLNLCNCGSMTGLAEGKSTVTFPTSSPAESMDSGMPISVAEGLSRWAVRMGVVIL